MDIYTLIKENVVDVMTPVITLTSIEEVSSGVWKLYSCNTEWAAPGHDITIDGETYRIDSFVQNEYLQVSGSVEPTQLYFQLSAPHFEWGSHRKTDIERSMEANKVAIIPMVYMMPVKNTGVKTWDSLYGFEGSVRIFFLSTFDPNNEVREVQQLEVINPMSAMADYFVSKVEDRPDLFEDILNMTEFEWMDFGVPAIWGNKEKIFDENLSGVERSIELKVYDTEDCCESITAPSCLPVNITGNDTFMIAQPSGSPFIFSIKDTNGATVGTYNALTKVWEVPAAGGDPVTNTVNGAAATDTPAGEAQAINVHDSAGDDVGTLSTDTANVKTIDIADSPIRNSDDSFSDTVKSEDTYTIADVDWTDSDGSAQSTPYDNAIVCTPSVGSLPVGGKFIPLSFEGSKIGEYEFSVPYDAANTFNTIKRDSSPQSFDMAVFSEQTVKANQVFVIEWDVLTNNNSYAFIGFGDKTNTGTNYTDLEFALLGFRSGSNVVWRWFESGSNIGDVATTINGDRAWCRIEYDGSNGIEVFINNTSVISRTSSFIGSENLCVKLLGRNGNTPVCDHLALRCVATPNKQVICLGDSISFGRATTGYPQHNYIYKMIAYAGHNYYHNIVASPGDTTSDVISDQSPRVSDLYDAILDENIVNLMIGINDIRSGVSLATIKTNIQTIVSDAQSDGCTVYIHTVTKDFNLSASDESDRSDLNTWILAGSSGADDEIDHTQNELESSLAYYESDQLHPNSNGMDQIAFDSFNNYN